MSTFFEKNKIGQNDIFVSTRPIFDNQNSLTQNGRMQSWYKIIELSWKMKATKQFQE